MRTRTIIRVAMRSLQRAPLRSALTALGVIVGVAAVVATTSIGTGAKTKIQETLSKPESRTIYLGAMAQRTNFHSMASQPSRANSLNPDDYYAIRRSVANISAASPRIYLQGAHVKANGQVIDVRVEGTDVDGFVTVPRQLLAGALFDRTDVNRAGNVCVIGESLARLLYSGDLRTGRRILLNDTTFTVIGIVDDIASLNPIMFRIQDLRVYVPFTSLLRRLDAAAQMSISIQARDIEQVALVQQDVGDVMEERRSGRKANFVTSNAFDSIKAYSDGSLTVARLLAAVGAIALVVGGIGIMNIMLVSVTERTREIGIRVAIGTRTRDILGQFLTEAVTLSLMGGGIGIGLGAIASWLITRLNGWPTEITLTSIFTALICSLGVGILFGYQPARRAATLRPVEALRNEG